MPARYSSWPDRFQAVGGGVMFEWQRGVRLLPRELVGGLLIACRVRVSDRELFIETRFAEGKFLAIVGDPATNDRRSYAKARG